MGLPLVGEEGVGHLTLGNPRGVERQDEKAHQRTSQCLAAQLVLPSAEKQRLVIFTTWAKKCSEKWLEVQTTCAVGRFANQILLKTSLAVSFSRTPP